MGVTHYSTTFGLTPQRIDNQFSSVVRYRRRWVRGEHLSNMLLEFIV